jgi:hypothetical protein
MSQTEFQLTGVKAVIAAMVVLGFLVFRFVSATSSFETDAAEELKFWLQGEYTGDYLAGSPAADEEMAQKLLALENMRFPEMSARGMPDDLLVRVRIDVDGAPPPFGDEVRYFQMEFSQVTGWRLRRELTKLSYYLNLF